LVFTRCPVRVPVGAPNIMTELFLGCPQFFQSDAGIVRLFRLLWLPCTSLLIYFLLLTIKFEDIITVLSVLYGLVIDFTDHFNTQLLTAINYSAIADLRTRTL
jgi:hypothetical protein